MYKKEILITLYSSLIFLWFSDLAFSQTERRLDSHSGKRVFKIFVYPDSTFQTMEHFGASDAWSCQFVGNWPLHKREAMADLLFSLKLDEHNNPLGIGLSIWRFNIGAGSARQGKDSGISDEWRRTESFLQADGSYDWTKQAGQVWFAQAAKSRGVQNLLVFPNSPPINLTKNGKAHAENGKTNLTAERFELYADYMSNVILGMQGFNLQVDYISPVNEPQWDWGGGQEGTPYWNNEIAELARVLNKNLEKKKLSTKIDLAEAGQIEYLYQDHNREGRANQIQDFFSPESENFLGSLSHTSQTISGHSYFTTSPISKALEKRKILAQTMSTFPKLKYWMSEYCILGGNKGEINGNKRDLGMESALYLARVIHNDLTIAKATAWHWWLAISPYDYKDGLIYIDYNKEDGDYYESKMLWALGNYSRFIRPGYERIAFEISSEKEEDIVLSAFRNPGTKELIFVIINSGNQETYMDIKNGMNNVQVESGYLTDAQSDLGTYDFQANEGIRIPPRSVVSLKAHLEKDSDKDY